MPLTKYCNCWTIPLLLTSGGTNFRSGESGRAPVNQFLIQCGSSWSMRLQIAFLFPKFTKAQEEEMLKMKLEQLEKEQQQGAPPEKCGRWTAIIES